MANKSYTERWLEAIGQVPGLHLRRAQVRALTAADLRDLQEDFGAADSMLEQLQALAEDDGDERDVRLDFEAQTVTPVD